MEPRPGKPAQHQKPVIRHNPRRKIGVVQAGEELLLIDGHCGRFLAVGKIGGSAEVWRVWQFIKELVDYAKEHCVFRELSAAKREQFGLLPR
jgi:hypothetical protein